MRTWEYRGQGEWGTWEGGGHGNIGDKESGGQDSPPY